MSTYTTTMYSSEPKPQTRRGHSTMSFGVLLLFLTSLTLGVMPASTRALGVSEIVDLSNAARVSNGLTAFKYNLQLAAAAQQKAEHMKSNKYFEHTAPDGTTGWYFIEQNGYAYTSAGENLAATNEGSSAVVNGWLNSPGHRANLLSREYLEVGYGIVYPDSFENYRGIYYVVALYGLPKSGAVVAPISVTNTLRPETGKADNNQNIAANKSGTLTLAKTNTSISIDPRVSITLFVVGFVMLIAGLALELRHFKHKPSLNSHLR